MKWPPAQPMPLCATCQHRRVSHFTPERLRFIFRAVRTRLPSPCSVSGCGCNDYLEVPA